MTTDRARKNRWRIAVSMGDPAGIGPEVILKAFGLLPKNMRNRLTVFGDVHYFRTLEKRLKTGTPVLDLPAAKAKDDGLRFSDIGRVGFRPTGFGRVDARFGRTAMRSVGVAAQSVLAGNFDALVTAPINKESVNLAGFRVAGHTEYLSKLCGDVPVAMMMSSEKLNVVVATTHVALRNVPKRLSVERLFDLMKLVDRSLRRFGVRKPHIAVCGLNPHASDGGLFGNEELRVIAPAIVQAKEAGLRVSGPHPADALFTPRMRETYDVALAMYHDQGLIPAKALAFGETVNVTLGLPFLRVSVDHGTAFDIAGKNKAGARPMAHAVRTAWRMLSGKL